MEEENKKIWDQVKQKFEQREKLEDILNDPQIFEIKNDRIRHRVDKIMKVVNSRMARKTTSLAGKVLDITQKVKSGNAISTGAALINSLEVAADFLDIPKPDPFSEFVKRNGLKESTKGHLVEMLVSPQILASVKTEQVFEDESTFLYKISLGENNSVYLRQTDKRTEGDISYYFKYYTDANFSFEKAYGFFWQFFDGKIYLTNRGKGDRPEQLRLKPLKFDISDLLIDDEELGKVGIEIEKCRAKKRSRSYLLVGPPGTGKSSFCFAAAHNFCPKVLKVDPSVMDHMRSGELEFFIETLRPDAVIFDDIDRCDTEGYLLFLLENLKRTFPELVIFASANDFEILGPAIVRPGRFDRTIWMENPDGKERETFITHYASTLNLDIPKDTFQMVVKETEGFSQAYLVELLERACNDADMLTSFKGSIKEFKRTLAMTEEEYAY